MRNPPGQRQLLIHPKDHQVKKAKGGKIERDEANQEHCFALIHYARFYYANQARTSARMPYVRSQIFFVLDSVFSDTKTTPHE